MELKEFQWLPHLEKSIPDSAKGYSMSLYAIALEGWRRGLQLKFINENRRASEMLFELKSSDNTYKFVVSRGELITQEAIKICRNKFETKEYLQKNNVSTPKGKIFDKNNSNKDIIAFANEIGFPLVVKPSDGTGGKGVIAGIENIAEFKEALLYVRETLGYNDVIVEDYFKGEDYRVYVVDDEVVGIIKRIPANVVGDGSSTINQLIKRENELREQSPILKSSLIKVDQELKNMLSRKKYTLKTIPPRGEKVFLKSKNNISAGGDPVDITDAVSDEIKQIAIEGIKAIPGLPHGGVDLMVDVENNKATIIEINTQANIRSHLFPMIGKARDLPSKLMDYYFPETKNTKRESLLYFDIAEVKKQFLTGRAQEYLFPSLPEGNIVATRFLINGQVQNVGYAAWVEGEIRNLDLNGFIKFIDKNTLSLIIAGEENKIEEFRETLHSSSSKNAVINEIIEKKRTSPVQLGFKIFDPELDKPIVDGYFPVRLEGISKLGQKKKISKTTKK